MICCTMHDIIEEKPCETVLCAEKRHCKLIHRRVKVTDSSVTWNVVVIQRSWVRTPVKLNLRVRSPCVLTLKVLNFWKFTSYCSLKPLWSGMGEVVPARTSPTRHPPSPPTVHQLSRLALYELSWIWPKIFMYLIPVCSLIPVEHSHISHNFNS